jgi:hypothetical protein
MPFENKLPFGARINGFRKRSRRQIGIKYRHRPSGCMKKNQHHRGQAQRAQPVAPKKPRPQSAAYDCHSGQQQRATQIGKRSNGQIVQMA